MRKPLTTRAMARELGISGPIVVRYKKRGMPMDDPAKAREWRALYVRPLVRPHQQDGELEALELRVQSRARPQEFEPQAPQAHQQQRETQTVARNVVDLFATDIGAEQLEDTIPRLRRLEKATALALERAINADNITVAVALRREHCTALKTLYIAEEKLILINANRGKLITMDRALAIVNEAMQSALLVLRRLPDLGRDEAERARLTAFLTGVLEEIKHGAAQSVKDRKVV